MASTPGDGGRSARLLGVITADDVIDVLQTEHANVVARMARSDAAELEKKSPAQVAKLRLPWIMATMFIELMAGVVIHIFDATLTSVILLASFMPIISAISSNTGLQSAAIIMRGVVGWACPVVPLAAHGAAATDLVDDHWGCLRAGNWVFGLVIFLGLFIVVNVACAVGTVVPMSSKRLGSISR